MKRTNSGNAFALFLKSQRKWENPPIKETDAKLFAELSGKSGYDVKRYFFESVLTPSPSCKTSDSSLFPPTCVFIFSFLV